MILFLISSASLMGEMSSIKTCLCLYTYNRLSLQYHSPWLLEQHINDPYVVSCLNISSISMFFVCPIGVLIVTLLLLFILQSISRSLFLCLNVSSSLKQSFNHNLSKHLTASVTSKYVLSLSVLLFSMMALVIILLSMVDLCVLPASCIWFIFLWFFFVLYLFDYFMNVWYYIHHE